MAIHRHATTRTDPENVVKGQRVCGSTSIQAHHGEAPQEPRGMWPLGAGQGDGRLLGGMGTNQGDDRILKSAVVRGAQF